jgi:spermidine synthase
MSPSPKSTLAGIFCLGLSIILFEIALTRVFAIMMWHHFTYMVISIGLLGFGASGSLLTATRLGSGKQSPARGLVWCSLAYGTSVMLAFCFATLVRIDSLAIWQQKENFLALFLIYLIIGVPFLLGGLGIGLALTRLVEHVNKLYFSDLVGSSIGAGLSVVLMKSFGSSAAVMMAGAFGLLAAFCFSLGAPRRYLALSVPGLVFAGIITLAFAGGAPVLGIAAANWRVPYAPGKEALGAEAILRELGRQGLLGGQDPELTKIHSATAEVEVGASVLGAPPMIGGDQGLVDQRSVESRAVGQDGTAPTMLFKHASDLSLFPFLDDSQAASAYVVHRAAGRTDQKVMVIGVGGGVDVMTALANGARKVTAVELNTAMIEMVTQRYDDYLGGLFRPGAHALSDRIELVNSEGRAWLRSHDDTYDVIQMSGVDSYTALSTGAYTLSESYLYTTEAVQDFYHHLNENGIVTYSRFIEGAPTKPRETLRLANIACTALRELAVPDPAAHIAVFQGFAWASTMVKKQPFTAVEIAALCEFACRQGFVGLVFDPTRTGTSAPEATHFACLRPRFLAAVAKVGGFATEPALLNEQVFAMMQAAVRVAKGEAITEALLPPALLTAGLAPRALEALTSLREDIVQQARYVAQAIADFSTVLRGSDDERARFIAEYDYDISPATDDRPFFFNYYRWSSLWGGQSRVHDPSLFAYHTDFPVGHMVLSASLLQIMLLAGLLILLPLRKLAYDGLETPGAWRYFGYFAALGLGFMLIEIALMQKLVIFLGHPTYALSVVLVSLLASAGTGSLLAGRIRFVERRHLRWILLAIVFVVVFDLIAIDVLLPLLLGESLQVRVLVVVLLLIPTGLVLGMPFPSGMRLVESQCPHLLPWGWAVNAFFSVFGSIFCIVLSMTVGFTNVLLAAIVVYGIGLLGMKTPAAPAPAVP